MKMNTYYEIGQSNRISAAPALPRHAASRLQPPLELHRRPRRVRRAAPDAASRAAAPQRRYSTLCSVYRSPGPGVEATVVIPY